MPSKTVYDKTGQPVNLEKTGWAGGEGEIYKISNDNDMCAKIYHDFKRTEILHKKILAMVNNPPEDPSYAGTGHRSITWPNNILYENRNNTGFIGYVMPLIDMKVFSESHRYYDPNDRLKYYGSWFNYRYLFNSAKNLASAIAAIHSKGHRVGDLRETNVLIAVNTYITLVDCDSFQVYDPQDKATYYSRVGTPEYLPYEMQKANFGNSDIDRYYSDLFALGVIIFKLLMFGVHPYQSRGQVVDNFPNTTDKIVGGFFAYEMKGYDIYPPAYAPTYEIVPESIRRLFKKCFTDGHKNPQARPTAMEWYTALRNEFKRIRKCSVNVNHMYNGDLHKCPWCRMFSASGKDPFPDVNKKKAQQVQAPPMPHPPQKHPPKQQPGYSQVMQNSLTQTSVSSNYTQYTQYSTNLTDKQRKQLAIDQLRTYIELALIDGHLTFKEKEYIYRLSRQLSVPDIITERLINKMSRILKSP